MPGKITIDVNRRTIGKARLLWNRLTPTRGAGIISNKLAELSSDRDFALSSSDILLGNYSRCLEAAGVLKIKIKKGTALKEIRKALNALAGRGFSAQARILPSFGFSPESTDPALNWYSLRRYLVPVRYRGETYFDGDNMLASGIISFGVGACMLGLQPAAVKIVSGILRIGLPPLRSGRPSGKILMWTSIEGRPKIPATRKSLLNYPKNPSLA